ncbi:serine/threonine-protein kinase [cf. Phormidesmis sp. LEGE 11477]|uniref:serine/threonine protein kinase n=1 Tax=cf. Phormidesmis sp. LEGE 11477 TaxID=1828680 RepID=UPI0018829F2F|nr:serine/threonine-protein kinase [cf. Phormidesmis sp. LEGE 11477]MBE9061038.1 serine/threonine protein kinase [cf. Phormidesmis sp. LEGE 11477]
MKAAIQKIERYSLQKELSTEERRRAGRQTFLAKDTSTQEPVVVKIIRIDQAVHTADQWVELKLFERESNILQTLDHPTLPRYKDAFETDIEGVRSFVLVQTYLEADSLETLLQSSKRFSEAEVLDIAKQLLTTLSYLHTQTPPVIHRDIKPSNILVGSPRSEADSGFGSIYLIDFGSIHTDLTKESGTITIVGSYGYIPLEQFAGRATSASDLYSLGMTLIHLVTGIHPADIAHINGKIQLPRSLQPALAQWLEKMTHPDLNRRFDSAQQALIALQAKEHSQSRYHHLKPEDTEIVVERGRDRIQISIKDSECNQSDLARIIIILIWLFVIFFQMPALLFIIILLDRILKRRIESFIIQLFKGLPDCWKWQVVVEIDRKRGIRIGTRRQNQTAVKWQKWASHFTDIDLLAYNPGYKFNSYTQGDQTIRQSGGGVLPELSVHAGELSYPIGLSQLSTAEYWWLGQELSDFIGLELQTIYPMPIVTVADNTCGGCGC